MLPPTQTRQLCSGGIWLRSPGVQLRAYKLHPEASIPNNPLSSLLSCFAPLARIKLSVGWLPRLHPNQPFPWSTILSIPNSSSRWPAVTPLPSTRQNSRGWKQSPGPGDYFQDFSEKKCSARGDWTPPSSPLFVGPSYVP